MDNLRRLEHVASTSGIGPLRIVTLPFPRPVMMKGERLPASYANFYIANGVVLVPTFNDPNDRVALNTLAELMPSHRVVGIHSVDLVWGLGTLHCLTQQEPLGARCDGAIKVPSHLYRASNGNRDSEGSAGHRDAGDFLVALVEQIRSVHEQLEALPDASADARVEQDVVERAGRSVSGGDTRHAARR